MTASSPTPVQHLKHTPQHGPCHSQNCCHDDGVLCSRRRVPLLIPTPQTLDSTFPPSQVELWIQLAARRFQLIQVLLILALAGDQRSPETFSRIISVIVCADSDKPTNFRWFSGPEDGGKRQNLRWRKKWRLPTFGTYKQTYMNRNIQQEAP